MIKDKNADKIAGGCAGALLGLLLIFVGAPLTILFGWITGQIVEWVCGDYVSNALNFLFNTDRFSPESIPCVSAALAFVGTFFRSKNAFSQTTNPYVTYKNTKKEINNA